MVADANKSRRWRRFLPRFGLRGMMLLVLIIGGGLGRIISQARVQREAVAAIVNAAGVVAYSRNWDRKFLIDRSGVPLSRGLQWVVDHLGIDYLDSVVAVDAMNVKSFDDEAIRQVGRLGRLEFVRLSGCGDSVTDAGLRHLAGLGRLRHLDLDFSAVKGPGLEVLRGMPDLLELKLEGIQISDADLKNLAGLVHLKHLDLTGTRLTDAGLESLAGLTDLEYFQIRGGPITAKGLGPVGEMKKLECLSLPYTHVESLAPIAHLREIYFLNLTGCRLDDAGLVPLAGWRKLATVAISDNSVGDAGLKHLAMLPALRSLQLDGTTISDSGLAKLSGLPILEHLFLSRTAITDAGLGDLVAFPKLATIVLTETGITDVGLARLSLPATSGILSVARTKVTTAGVSAFAARHPRWLIAAPDAAPASTAAAR